MTRFGVAALCAGLAALVLGVVFDWLSFDLLGIGLLATVLFSFAGVARPSRLFVEREIQPPRVPKGEPAVAVLTFTNRSRGRHPATLAEQPFGTQRVRTVIPRLRGGEHGSRMYRLPTTHRGVFDVPPIEVTRRDAFELFRISRHHGQSATLWVYPRILDLAPLPLGRTRHLDGPSSDSSPSGNVTFHRLRDYTEGDDLRLVHWRSSARAGRLLVRHNVDTSQPYTVVLLDERAAQYTSESFESAVDVAASVIVMSARDRAPVELRGTGGDVLGGPQSRDATALVDHLTAVQPTGTSVAAAQSLRQSLLALRQARGGTSLVVVTGRPDADALPALAGLRRRFERVVLVCVDPDRAGEPPYLAGVQVIVASDSDAVRTAWNLRVPSVSAVPV